MADPVTLTMIMLATATAVKTVSDLREGTQASAIEQYNARVAQAQAGAVRTSAAFESETLTKQSEVEQARIAREKGQAIGKQRALYAKAGVRLDEGSPLEVMADTASQFELDLAANRYNLATGMEKIRYESQTQQAQLTAESEYRRQLAKSRKTSSYLTAGSTLLIGGAKVASSWPTTPK